MKCVTTVKGTTASGRYLHVCQSCGRETAFKSPDPAMVKMQCGLKPDGPLTALEKASLFPDSDPTLLGNRIAALTSAIGIPPCGSCNKRKAWLNKAHEWIRAQLNGS